MSRIYVDTAGVKWTPVTHTDGRSGWVQMTGGKQVLQSFQTTSPDFPDAKAAEAAGEWEQSASVSVQEMNAAVAAAIKDERFRISMILNSPYYEGREVQARALIDEGVSLQCAENVLRVMPRKEEPKPAAPMGAAQAAAMAAMFAEVPRIKPDPQDNSPESAESRRHAELRAAVADAKTRRFGVQSQ